MGIFAPMERHRSARRALLFRGQRRRHGDVAEGQLELVGIEPSAGGRPVFGGELEVAVAGPIRRNRYVKGGSSAGRARWAFFAA